MSQARVAIVMGSNNDREYFTSAQKTFDDFGIGYDLKILSAHRTPEDLKAQLTVWEEGGITIFIAGAGGAAHLAGVVASLTTKPVIGVPLPSSPLNGLDALLSTVQMPGGMPVATMAIGEWGAKNAALFALSILALNDEAIAEKMVQNRASMREKVIAANG